MSQHDTVRKIHHQIDELVDQIERDGKIDDDESRLIVELMQTIEDKLADLLAKYGIEIGDERMD